MALRICVSSALSLDEGGPIYCGTYTAYSGYDIASEMLITEDFRTFRLQPSLWLSGEEQGHGALPAQDQRRLRHHRAA